MLDDDAFLAAGVALYAGEGSKTDGTVKFANTDPRDGAVLLRVAAPVLRRQRDEARVRVYLHDGLDLTAAEAHWSQVTGVPLAQFGKAYRAVADPSIRRIKHEFGCVYVSYACATTHRRVMGLVRALLSSSAIPG